MLTRREFIRAGGVVLAGLVIPNGARFEVYSSARAAGIIEIYMKSDPLGSEVWFDPIGIYIESGQTVRWIVTENVHTTTAYHPRNNNHSLRIPKNAKPWDSGFMQPGDTFEVLLTIEGVYDYFCLPHEAAGMVGRIIVGKPTGPGSLPFDYYKGKEETKDWRSVPLAAQRAFPSTEQILSEKIIRLNRKISQETNQQVYRKS